MNEHDLRFIRHAIEVAQQARNKGNHPFGAVLVDARGNVLLTAENTVVTEYIGPVLEEEARKTHVGFWM